MSKNYTMKIMKIKLNDKTINNKIAREHSIPQYGKISNVRLMIHD